MDLPKLICISCIAFQLSSCGGGSSNYTPTSADYLEAQKRFDYSQQILDKYVWPNY